MEPGECGVGPGAVGAAASRRPSLALAPRAALPWRAPSPGGQARRPALPSVPCSGTGDLSPAPGLFVPLSPGRGERPPVLPPGAQGCPRPGGGGAEPPPPRSGEAWAAAGARSRVDGARGGCQAPPAPERPVPRPEGRLNPGSAAVPWPGLRRVRGFSLSGRALPHFWALEDVWVWADGAGFSHCLGCWCCSRTSNPPGFLCL